MKNCYINGTSCISAQETLSYSSFIDGAQELTENIVLAKKPNFKDYISPVMLRRMATGVRMGVAASVIALKDANLDLPQAIVTGTGMGCIKDTETFLKSIIENDEKYLTPTSFIKSTHNTVGAQIALGLKCKGYNVTYSNGANSFESGLIDSLLMIKSNDSDNVLVGGIEEVGERALNSLKLINHIKNDDFLKDSLLKTKTKGTIFSEGAQFFTIENKITESTYTELIDVEIHNEITTDNVQPKLTSFLKQNNLETKDLDVVLLGFNGDVEYDAIYENLQLTILKDTQQLYYKHLSGEYNTASAFGLWLACNIVKNQDIAIPEVLKLNNKTPQSIKTILLYNQYRGENHSFTLIKKC